MSPHSTVSFLTGERHPGLADDDNADEDVDRSSDDDDNVMQMRFRQEQKRKVTQQSRLG